MIDKHGAEKSLDKEQEEFLDNLIKGEDIEEKAPKHGGVYVTVPKPQKELEAIMLVAEANLKVAEGNLVLAESLEEAGQAHVTISHCTFNNIPPDKIALSVDTGPCEECENGE